MTTSTPGPWHVGLPDGVGVMSAEMRIYGLKQSILLADCGTWRRDSRVLSLEEIQANARLMASAYKLVPTDDEREEMECAGDGWENANLVDWLRESRQATRDRADRADAWLAEARLIIATYRRDHELEHSCDSDPCDNCTLAAQWLKSTER